VDGLEKGGEVRYMGIKMGVVTAVFLLPADPARVGVRVMLETGTPVNTATVATLRQQGLTGVPFINLTQDAALKPAPLLVMDGQDYPVIRSQLGEMDALMRQLPDLERNLTGLLSAANAVLSAENRANFTGLLHNLNAASADVPTLIANLAQTSQQLRTLITHVDATLKRSERGLTSNMQELEATLRSIHTTSQRLDTLVRDIDHVVVDNAGNIQGVLEESRKMAASIRQLSESLERNPSQLIYQPAPQGVELPP
jgi:phospholipid/cholesterol/gamma-HCH transport system substrate-binding protein